MINPEEQLPEDFYRDQYYALVGKYIALENKYEQCRLLAIKINK